MVSSVRRKKYEFALLGLNKALMMPYFFVFREKKIERNHTNMYRMLEFDKVKDRWRELTKTEYAVEMIESRQHILNESELRRELRDTTDAKRFIEKCGAPPLTAIDEGKEIIAQAEKEGCLTPYQLERMEKVLVMIQRMKDIVFYIL